MEPVQAEQLMPPVPQVRLEGTWQTPALQQPSGQSLQGRSPPSPTPPSLSPL
jgi:hypothetical protein